jgi:hypothetical protein
MREYVRTKADMCGWVIGAAYPLVKWDKNAGQVEFLLRDLDEIEEADDFKFHSSRCVCCQLDLVEPWRARSGDYVTANGRTRRVWDAWCDGTVKAMDLMDGTVVLRPGEYVPVVGMPPAPVGGEKHVGTLPSGIMYEATFSWLAPEKADMTILNPDQLMTQSDALAMARRDFCARLVARYERDLEAARRGTRC